MRHVLIICESFPPQSDVGGLRPAMMAKYLPEFGWTPCVLTRSYGPDHPQRDEKMRLDGLPPAQSVIRVEVSALDERQYKASRGWKGKMRDFFEMERAHPPGLCAKMQREAPRRLPASAPDAIWATVPGYAPLRLGRDLAERFGVPWIADFRDIPEQETGMPRPWREHLLLARTVWRRRRLVSTAALLTSVSARDCSVLEHKLGKRCALVSNGFDETLFFPMDACRTDRFRIVYTGRILNRWYRDPTLLFQALDGLLGEGGMDPRDLELVFYGTEAPLLRGMVAPHRCSACVRLLDRISYHEVPRALAEASVLLVLTNEGRRGILPTKFFECLAMGRPVLCIRAGPADDLPVILRDTKRGLGTNSVSEVKDFLLRAYRHWRTTGLVPTTTERSVLETFSRRSQAQRLAALLDEVVAGHAAAVQTPDAGRGYARSPGARAPAGR